MTRLTGSDDPRLTGDHIRTVDGPNGTVTVVGVVHDHPASIFRAQEVTTTLNADILALELPPLAVPLFRQHANDKPSSPAPGGEMTASIQAAQTERIVGIDGPSVWFIVRLLGTVYRERMPLTAIRSLASGVYSAMKHALLSRVAVLLEPDSSLQQKLITSHNYDSDWTDLPRIQAADERKHLSRALAATRSLAPPPETRLLDDVREEHMAKELHRLRQDGDVVAVIGRDHVESVTNQLAETQ